MISNKRFIYFSFSLLLGLVVQVTAFAQKRSEEEINQIKSAKVAMITNRLNLTPEQSASFWPVYNEFSEKKRDLNRQHRSIVNAKKEAGAKDQDALNNLTEIQEIKQKQLDLEKEYQDRFLKVISASQVTELHKAEAQFNEMLLQRLRQNRGKGGPAPR